MQGHKKPKPQFVVNDFSFLVVYITYIAVYLFSNLLLLLNMFITQTVKSLCG